MTKLYDCPVCGYTRLDQPPFDGEICSCCGTEFGYHDAGRTHEELRHRWIESGARWWSTTRIAPKGWSAYEQLQTAGYHRDATALGDNVAA